MMQPAAARQGRGPSQGQGLTLIELMIGLAILAVLLSLAVPSFQAYLQRQRLKAAALTLEVDLREARHEAVRRGAPLYLAWSGGSSSADWCYAIATQADCPCTDTGPAPACALKRVRASDLKGLSVQKVQDLRLDPGSGLTDQVGPAAVWQTRAGDRVQVAMTALGRPQVCMLEGTLQPLQAC